MLRKVLFNGITVLSALLTAALLVLWASSYFRQAGLDVERNGLDGPGDYGELSCRYELGSSRGKWCAVFTLDDARNTLDQDGNPIYPPAPPSAPPYSVEFWFNGRPTELGGLTSNVPGSWGRTCLGFEVGRVFGAGSGNFTDIRYLVAPYWPFVALMLFASAPGAVSWRRRRRADRLRGRACPTCGYDLRATPLRCPECGHVLKAEP